MKTFLAMTLLFVVALTMIFMAAVAIDVTTVRKLMPISDPNEKPCYPFDLIKLKIGNANLSFPTSLRASIHANDDHPKIRWQKDDATSPPKLCSGGADRVQATGMTIEALSREEWVERWPGLDWVPEGATTSIGPRGILIGDFQRFGDKEDLAYCYSKFSKTSQACALVRTLPDLDIRLVSHVVTTPVSLEGQAVTPSEQRTAEEWPEFLDNLEMFWRTQLIVQAN